MDTTCQVDEPGTGERERLSVSDSSSRLNITQVGPATRIFHSSLAVTNAASSPHAIIHMPNNLQSLLFWPMPKFVPFIPVRRFPPCTPISPNFSTTSSLSLVSARTKPSRTVPAVNDVYSKLTSVDPSSGSPSTHGKRPRKRAELRSRKRDVSKREFFGVTRGDERRRPLAFVHRRPFRAKPSFRAIYPAPLSIVIGPLAGRHSVMGGGEAGKRRNVRAYL